MFNGAVKRTSELDRILSLPRRQGDVAEFAKSLIQPMSELLRQPWSKEELRGAQALALHDAGCYGGAFCPLEVGGGKTLITLLASYVMGAKRPALLLPAGLIKKTLRDFKSYKEKGWLVQLPRIFSYDELGRVTGANKLFEYAPDLMIGDEIHRLKSKHAAVTRRVIRLMQKYPETKFVALSGTIMRKSLKDFAHILRWCLKDRAPVPVTQHELDDWAAALDENVNELEQVDPGALKALCGGCTDIEGIRRGFRDRLIQTPGVVCTIGEGERVDCSIYIRALRYDVSLDTDIHFRKLRKDMQTPDGWQLMHAVDVWRHARELALGLFYRWSPRPPDDWRLARREWNAFVREVLSHSRSLDSELQVANACDDGKLDDTALKAWREVRDTFKPNTEAVWCDDSALNVCLEWMKTPGIVWVEHSLFAKRLSEVSGCPYFGEQGLDENNVFIDDAPNDRAIIASVKANREGRNLQGKWSRNLVTCPMEGSDIWNQLLGRTHRPGQMADEVIVDVLLGCLEHDNAWRRALENAYAVRDTTGTESKLLIADLEWPSLEEVTTYAGNRWRLEKEPKAA